MAAADPIILATLLISGLLAMVRGFTLELLGLIAMVGAALIAWLGSGEVYHWLEDSLPKEPVGPGIVIAVLFIVTLVPLWIIGHFLGRNVRSSTVGALDRAVGFGFGVIRGVFLLAITYLIFIKAFGGADVPEPDWIQEARLMPVVRATAELLMALVSKDSPIVKSLADSLLLIPVLLLPRRDGKAPR